MYAYIYLYYIDICVCACTTLLNMLYVCWDVHLCVQLQVRNVHLKLLRSGVS